LTKIRIFLKGKNLIILTYYAIFITNIFVSK
jgi:hypothetical protein